MLYRRDKNVLGLWESMGGRVEGLKDGREWWGLREH
jgi:hypothetical protein